MRLVGLTGGIATGKTTVSSILREQGFPVIDCDVIARDVVKKGRWGWRRVVAAFGKEVLMSDNEVNRELLGAMVFRDSKLRKKLNTATHLPVFLEVLKQIIIAWLLHTTILIVDMPLLFETGMEKWFSPIVLVWCDEDTQIERLRKRDNCDIETARLKIRAQMPLDFKAEKSRLLIDNSSTKSNTKLQVKDFSGVLRRERVVSFFMAPIPLLLNFGLACYVAQLIKSYY